MRWASPKRETAPGEATSDIGPRWRSRVIGSVTVEVPERALRTSLRSMEGASDCKVVCSLHGEPQTVVSADSASNGAQVPGLARSVTEASEVDQLSLNPGNNTLWESDGRGHRSVRCIVNCAEPRVERGNSNGRGSWARHGCSRTTCRWQSLVASISGWWSNVRSQGRCENVGLALEELVATLTQAARGTGANGCVMLARGVEAARGRSCRVARKGRAMERYDDRRSGRLAGPV